MKNECNIIRDILPLYIEGLASADTVAFVEEHLEKCSECRKELENMKSEISLDEVVSVACESENDSKPLRKFARKWKRKKRIVITSLAVVLLIVALLGSCFVSYVKFDTANPFSATNGFIQVVVADKDYIEIQKSPKVMLAQPGEAVFLKYMESRGYTEMVGERLGSLRVFTNGKEKEIIICSQNAYYAKWCWQ